MTRRLPLIPPTEIAAAFALPPPMLGHPPPTRPHDPPYAAVLRWLAEDREMWPMLRRWLLAVAAVAALVACGPDQVDGRPVYRVVPAAGVHGDIVHCPGDTYAVGEWRCS